MPTYVYACKQCEDRVEVVQRMSDEPLRECGSCGGDLRKVLFAPAVVYKGSGFYVTDYKNGGSKKESAGSSSAEKGDGSAAESKSGESKSEAKGESAGDSKAETKSDSRSEAKSEAKLPGKTEAKSSA